MCPEMKKDCRKYRPDPNWESTEENWYYGRPCVNENCGIPAVLHWIPFDDENENEFE